MLHMIQFLNPMMIKTLLISSFLLSSLFCTARDVPIAVYWGQASKGTPQNDLAYYCESESVDIIILAFVSVFGEKYVDLDEHSVTDYELNLSNKCNFDGTSYHCPNVGNDIKKCQKLGKKILLSFGGEEENPKKPTYGFKDNDEAKRFAQVVWDHFGDNTNSGSDRPFGDAVVDGFDIDSESMDQTGYLVFVQELSNISKTESSKELLFSSAPQCIFPDESNSNLINNFELDYIFIQFYNNECNLSSKESFNYYQWSDHMLELGYTKTKLFLGLPSSKGSAANGYVENVELIKQRIEEVGNSSSESSYFGGVMFWDASKGFDHLERDSEENSYIYKVWKDLGSVESLLHNETSSDSSVTNHTNGSTATRMKNESSALSINHILGLFTFLLMIIVLSGRP